MNDQNLICRTCLSILENNNFTYIDDENGYIENVGNIREMIQFCIPELDLYVSTCPIICHRCLPLLVTVYNFKNKCLHVESIIRAYIVRNNLVDYNQVNLNCVLMDDMRIKNRIIENKIRSYMSQDNSQSIIQSEHQKQEKPSLPHTVEESPEINLGKNTSTLKTSEAKKHEITIGHEEKDTVHEIEEYAEKENQLNLLIKIDKSKLDMQTLNNEELTNDNQSSPAIEVNHPSNSFNNGYVQYVPTMVNGTENMYSQPQIFQCKQCNFVTTDIKNVAEHNSTFHRNEFMCSYCPFGTNQLELLSKHIISVHPQPPPNIFSCFGAGQAVFQYCDICNFVTKSQESLRQHRARKHISTEMNGLYCCPLCPYRSSTFYLINRHIESKHDRKNEMKCDFCSYQTKDKSNFRKHVFTHSTKPMQCNSCSYQCVSPYQMRRHIKKNHGDRDLENFKITIDDFRMVAENGIGMENEMGIAENGLGIAS